MKEKVYKVYVITLSRTFPTTHPKAGEPTGFGENLRKTKLHTIRANYEFWEKRFKQIESGEACLSIRQWTGKPYASKQVELCRLTKEDGIGLQMLDLSLALNGSIGYGIVDEKIRVTTDVLATNDGLSEVNWQDWFKGYDKNSHLAIIHFTPFRY